MFSVSQIFVMLIQTAFIWRTFGWGFILQSKLVNKIHHLDGSSKSDHADQRTPHIIKQPSFALYSDMKKSYLSKKNLSNVDIKKSAFPQLEFDSSDKDIVTGEVIFATKYGAELQLDDGTIAFVPRFEASFQPISDQELRNKFSLGKKVKVMIIGDFEHEGVKFASAKRAEMIEAWNKINGEKHNSVGETVSGDACYSGINDELLHSDVSTKETTDGNSSQVDSNSSLSFNSFSDSSSRINSGKNSNNPENKWNDKLPQHNTSTDIPHQPDVPPALERLSNSVLFSDVSGLQWQGEFSPEEISSPLARRIEQQPPHEYGKQKQQQQEGNEVVMVVGDDDNDVYNDEYEYDHCGAGNDESNRNEVIVRILKLKGISKIKRKSRNSNQRHKHIRDEQGHKHNHMHTGRRVMTTRRERKSNNNSKYRYKSSRQISRAQGRNRWDDKMVVREASQIALFWISFHFFLILFV